MIRGLLAGNTSPISTAGTPARIEGLREFTCIFGRDRDQQSPGGLRVEENRSYLIADSVLVANDALGKFAIGFQASGNVASTNTFERALKQRNAIGMEAKRHSGSERNFAGVPDQAETGDIGHSVDGEAAVSSELCSAPPGR